MSASFNDRTPTAAELDVLVNGPGSDVDRLVQDQVPGGVFVPPSPVSEVLKHTKTQVQATVTHTGRDAAFAAGYYSRRLHVLVWVLVKSSPVGVWRVLAGALRWVTDHEGRVVCRNTSHGRDDFGSTDAQAWLRVKAQHRETVLERLRIVGALSALSAVAWLAAWVAGVSVPPTVLALGGVAGVLGLGWIGRDTSKPVIAPPSHVVANAGPPRLSSDLIVTALAALGIGELNKALGRDADAVRFVAPITRDGAGYRADIDLPAGVTAGDIVERRDRLASGLRRPVACVWPEGDQRMHEGRLILWVGDQPMSRGTATAWPLERTGKVDLFEAFPFGTDQRGRNVTLTLMFASLVIGAVPRMGKTAALRLILLAAALDPRAELHVHNLKGGGDLDPFEPVAHYLGAGDDPEDIEALLTDLRAVRADMRRRYKALRELPRDVAPDAKITGEIASKRSLRLHPVVIGLDEVQVMFEHKDHGDEFEEIVTDLVKRGPAVGIMAIVATQRPDAKSLPSGIRDNAVMRFCLMVTSQNANDMVLGTSAYKQGIRATMFSRNDLGTGYLVGDGDDPQIVKAAYVDTPGAARIIARARAERERLGLLTGMALGELPEPDEVRDMADLCMSVWPDADTAKLSHEDLAARLVEAGHTVTKEAVSADLGALGINNRVQVYRDGKNRRGCARTDLAQHLADR